MTRLEAIRERYEEPLRYEMQVRDDIALLLACVDEMRGALRLLEQLTAEGSTQVRTVTAAQLNAHTRNAIASIEEKLR